MITSPLTITVVNGLDHDTFTAALSGLFEGPPWIVSAAWQARLRRLSAPFANDPLIFDSDVSLACQADNRYYVNSDGSQITDGAASCRLFIEASTKADDGMDLPLYASYFARTPEALPDEKDLATDVKKMIAVFGFRVALIPSR